MRGVAVIDSITAVKRNAFFKKIIFVAAAFSVARIFPEMGWLAADWGMSIFGYPKFGFFWDVAHHAVQMLLAVMVMTIPLWNKTFSEWGFNNDKKDLNRRIVVRFLAGFVVFFSIGKTIYLCIMGWPPALVYNPETTTIWQLVIFRITMPGLSEEILFRALVMGILMKAWKGSFYIGKVRMTTAGIWSALIFVAAHVGFTIFPFKILYYDIGQMVSAFIFGLFYSVVYIETGSLLAPVAAHNIVDGIGTAIDWILTGLVG